MKGYEYEKGKFVVLKDEDFKRVALEATDTLMIMDFVERGPRGRLGVIFNDITLGKADSSVEHFIQVRNSNEASSNRNADGEFFILPNTNPEEGIARKNGAWGIFLTTVKNNVNCRSLLCLLQNQYDIAPASGLFQAYL